MKTDLSARGFGLTPQPHIWQLSPIDFTEAERGKKGKRAWRRCASRAAKGQEMRYGSQSHCANNQPELSRPFPTWQCLILPTPFFCFIGKAVFHVYTHVHTFRIMDATIKLGQYFSGFFFFFDFLIFLDRTSEVSEAVESGVVMANTVPPAVETVMVSTIY